MNEEAVGKWIPAIAKTTCHPERGSATEGSTLPEARFFAAVRFAQSDKVHTLARGRYSPLFVAALDLMMDRLTKTGSLARDDSPAKT
jgi:hypothetical protein